MYDIKVSTDAASEKTLVIALATVTTLKKKCTLRFLRMQPKLFRITGAATSLRFRCLAFLRADFLVRGTLHQLKAATIHNDCEKHKTFTTTDFKQNLKTYSQSKNPISCSKAPQQALV